MDEPEEAAEELPKKNPLYQYVHLPLLISNFKTYEMGHSFQSIGLIKITTNDNGIIVYQLHKLSPIHCHPVNSFLILKFNLTLREIPQKETYSKIYGYISPNSSSKNLEVYVNIWSDLGNFGKALKLDCLLYEANNR